MADVVPEFERDSKLLIRSYIGDTIRDDYRSY